MTIPIGKIKGLPIEEYHAADALSHSKLEDFRKRPSYFFKKHIAKTIEREDTASTIIGNAAHCLILEGEVEYAKRYAAMPETTPDGKPFRRGTKAWDAAVAALPAGVCILKADDDALNRRLRDSVLQNDVARAILSDPGFEPEVTWRIQLSNGVVLQCRTDGWIGSITEATAAALVGQDIHASAGQSLVADLKTCGSLSDDDIGSFTRNAQGFGYHRQDPFYRQIVAAVQGVQPLFVFMACEKAEPFETACFALDDEALRIGQQENAEDLPNLLECHRIGQWPGKPQSSVVRLSLPEWYVRKADRRNNLNQM